MDTTPLSVIFFLLKKENDPGRLPRSGRERSHVYTGNRIEEDVVLYRQAYLGRSKIAVEVS